MALWVHKGGSAGEREQRILEHGVLGIGWELLSTNLGKLKSKADILDAYRTTYPEANGNRAGNHVRQLYAFVHAAHEGDMVVMPLKSRPVIAIGKISGPYRYDDKYGKDMRHIHPVTWIKTEVPRTAFGQDLLYSFGAFLTFCQVTRNNAEERVAAVLKKGVDPFLLTVKSSTPKHKELEESQLEAESLVTDRDLEEYAIDQIRAHIEANFKGHKMAELVNAILKSQGFITRVSPPGPDGGTDILAGSGSLGLESPRFSVQVKSGTNSCDMDVFKSLKGTMGDFNTEQSLLVSWGGFKTSVLKEIPRSFFQVRLWDSGDLIDALLKNYEKLPEDIKTQLPLKRIWVFVPREN